MANILPRPSYGRNERQNGPMPLIFSHCRSQHAFPRWRGERGGPPRPPAHHARERKVSPCWRGEVGGGHPSQAQANSLARPGALKLRAFHDQHFTTSEQRAQRAPKRPDAAHFSQGYGFPGHAHPRARSLPLLAGGGWRGPTRPALRSSHGEALT